MGVSIAFWRRLRKKKQKELAKDCGWPAPRISRYETARAWPDEESIETLARKLDISPEDLRRTQKMLYDHELAVEGEAEAAETVDEEPPEEGVVRERPEEPSTDLTTRWEELRNLEAEARVRRDQLERETQEVLFRSAITEIRRK